MQENNQLTIPDNSQVNAHLATLTAEATQAVRHVWTLTEAGADQEAIDLALVAVTDHLQALVEFGQQATAIIGGLTEMVTAITSRADRLADDVAALQDRVDQLDEEMEERARDLADGMTEARLEMIFEDEEQVDTEKVWWLAERMIDEGVDAVKEEMRDATNRQLREAEEAALHEMGYGDTMPLLLEDEE